MIASAAIKFQLRVRTQGHATPYPFSSYSLRITAAPRKSISLFKRATHLAISREYNLTRSPESQREVSEVTRKWIFRGDARAFQSDNWAHPQVQISHCGFLNRLAAWLPTFAAESNPGAKEKQKPLVLNGFRDGS